jgi:tetratricopeptide (TPR) repeat protein
MLPRGRVLASWTLAALGILAGPWGDASSRALLSHLQTPPDSTRRPASAGRRVAVFGVDAADWREVDRLAAAGKLPAFARLAQVGARGVLRADPPLLSPIIWTTIATGRRPEDHGVLDFMVDVPGGGQAPVDGGARKAKALWEIWSDAGRTVQVTGWWATWPADRVRGFIASDRIAAPHVAAPRPDLGLVHPPSAWGDVAPLLVEPAAIGAAELRRLLPVTARELAAADEASRQPDGRLYRDRLAHFRAAVAATRTYRAIATRRAVSVQPDFWAVYLDVVDTASHLFVADPVRGPRAIESAYREVDAALAESAQVLDPDTLLLVVSDHGFQPADAGIRDDPSDLAAGASAWHRPSGIVAVTTAGALAGTRAPPGFAALGVVSPLDVAPTLLAWAGLAVAADMPGRVLPALVPASAHLVRVASYGAHVLPEPTGVDASLGARRGTSRERATAAGKSDAAAELERLRALGYVSGAAATTSLGRVNLGEILYRRGDFQGATRELEAVRRLDPLNQRASLWLARAYIAQGRRSDAASVYDRLVQASRSTSVPLDPVVILAATDNDLAAGRTDAAQARLQRLPAGSRDAPEALVAAGAVSAAQNRMARAEESFRSALRAAPADFEALQRLMDLLLAARRTSHAVAVTAEAAARFPSSPQHLSLAGEAALAARQFKDADRHFSAALALAPDSAAVRLDLARARLLGGRPGAALDALRDASAGQEIEMVRGAARASLRDWPGAIAAFERALGLGPASPALLNSLAAAQFEAGRRSDAVASLERSLEMAPDQPSARALLQRARER